MNVVTLPSAVACASAAALTAWPMRVSAATSHVVPLNLYWRLLSSVSNQISPADAPTGVVVCQYVAILPSAVAWASLAADSAAAMPVSRLSCQFAPSNQ